MVQQKNYDRCYGQSSSQSTYNMCANKKYNCYKKYITNNDYIPIDNNNMDRFEQRRRFRCEEKFDKCGKNSSVGHEKKYEYLDPCCGYKPSRCCYDPCRNRNGRVRVENLVSNLLGTGFAADPNLVNAWGLVLIENVVWVVANGTSKILTFDLNGNILPTVVNVLDSTGAPAGPTGIVQNTTQGFRIQNGGLLFPALFLVATEAGTINAYNSSVSTTNAVVVIDRSSVGAVYKGLTIIGDRLYAADFHNNRIDVFDSNFNLLGGFAFSDPTLPAGYAPFNVYNIDGLLYVTYALQLPPANKDDQSGPGNGYINIFNPDGTFVRRFASRGVLNSPWGIVTAPSILNLPLGALLVGNFGDGYINIFRNTGEFFDKLRDCSGNIIHIDGLWGLITNYQSGLYGSGNTIYFAAGPNGELNGLFGRLVPDCPNSGNHYI
jgi:uncharacterized protein (TIGR03118 family)